MIDTRIEEDITTSELTRILRARPRYTYTYIGKYHDLRLSGLMRYVRFNADEHGTTLYNLQFEQERLKPEQIDKALDEYMEGFTLPYAVEKAPTKYNWLIAVHAHNSNYRDAISQLAVSKPTSLNYNYDDRPFSAIFERLNTHVHIPVYGQNIFDYVEKYKLVFTKTNSVDEVDELLQIHANSCSHITWHLQKHIFVYPDSTSLLQKILLMIIADSELHGLQLSQREPRGSRPTERMITYSADDHTRRIIAVAPLILNTVYDVKLDIRDAFTHLKELADDIYDLKGEDYLSDVYSSYQRMYDNMGTIYLTQNQYALYSRSMWPKVHMIGHIIPKRLISSRLNQYVRWKSPLHSDRYYTFRALDNVSVQNGLDIPTTLIRLKWIPDMTNSIDELFNSISFSTTAKTNPATAQPAHKNIAYNRYATTDSFAQTYMNNLQKTYVMFKPSLDTMYQRVLSGQASVRAGSLEHLCLCIHLTSGIVAQHTVIVSSTVVLRKNINNSLIKLIACYVYAVRKLSGKVNVANYILPNPRILFLGAEQEPAMDVLRLFYGSHPMTITGIGNRSIGKGKLRTDIRDNTLLNFKSDIIISDIDQADYTRISQAHFDQQIQLAKTISTLCASNSSISLVKLNMPSVYLLNEIVTELHTTSSNNKVSLSVVKFSAQKQFGHEVYLSIIKTNEVQKLFFDEIPIFRSYTQTFSLAKVEPTLNRVASNELYYSVPTLFRLIVAKDQMSNVLDTAHMMTVSCDDFFTRSTAGGDSRIVCFTGRRSDARVALMSRMNDVDEFGNTNSCVITQNGKTFLTKVPYLTDIMSAFPNGLGDIQVYDSDNVRRILSMGSIMRQCVYSMINDNISADLNAQLTQVIMVGGRDLSEIVAIQKLSHVPLKVYDPVGQTLDLPEFKLKYKKEEFVFDQQTYENTMLLALFVIMNNADGSPRSAEDQINVLDKIYSSLESGSMAYVQIYVDDGASTLDRMSFNEDIGIIRVGDRHSINVGDYGAVEMLTTLEVETFVKAHLGTRVLYPTFRTFVDICQTCLILPNVNGSVLRDVALRSFCVLEIVID